MNDSNDLYRCEINENTTKIVVNKKKIMSIDICTIQ